MTAATAETMTATDADEITALIELAKETGAWSTVTLVDGRTVRGYLHPCNYRQVEGKWGYQGPFTLVNVTGRSSGKFRRLNLSEIAAVSVPV